MTKTIKLTDAPALKLERLADEDGLAAASLLENLIREEDNRRHVTWHTTERRFVRHKCGRAGCQEIRTPELEQYRD